MPLDAVTPRPSSCEHQRQPAPAACHGLRQRACRQSSETRISSYPHACTAHGLGNRHGSTADQIEDDDEDDILRSLDEVVSDYKVTAGDGLTVEIEADYIRFRWGKTDGLLDSREKTRLLNPGWWMLGNGSKLH